MLRVSRSKSASAAGALVVARDDGSQRKAVKPKPGCMCRGVGYGMVAQSGGRGGGGEGHGTVVAEEGGQGDARLPML
eukprot:302041-Chlamydomonas_euryale.AAC.2